MISLRHSPKQLLTVTATAAVLAATGVASAADAPVVSKQGTIFGTALVDFPGTGIEKGDWIGSKAAMVYKTVTMEHGQKARLTLKARKGQRIRGLGAHDGQKLSVTALNRDYAGKRSVTVRVEVNRRAGNDEVTERIYALSR